MDLIIISYSAYFVPCITTRLNVFRRFLIPIFYTAPCHRTLEHIYHATMYTPRIRSHSDVNPFSTYPGWSKCSIQQFKISLKLVEDTGRTGSHKYRAFPYLAWFISLPRNNANVAQCLINTHVPGRWIRISVRNDTGNGCSLRGCSIGSDPWSREGEGGHSQSIGMFTGQFQQCRCCYGCCCCCFARLETRPFPSATVARS